MNRYDWLERQLDRDDLTDEEFNAFNKEINELQTRKNDIRDKREQERKELQEQVELDKILSLTEEEVEKMYEDACIKYQDVNGLSFKDWYEQSLKYYEIDAKFNVHAKARSSNTVEIVQHPTLAQAKLTILTRIKYKFYDHAKRGRDFAWDFEKKTV